MMVFICGEGAPGIWVFGSGFLIFDFDFLFYMGGMCETSMYECIIGTGIRWVRYREKVSVLRGTGQGCRVEWVVAMKPTMTDDGWRRVGAFIIIILVLFIYLFGT